MAELAFQIDLFSCCACFSDLEAADMVSFFYPFWQHRMHYYETAYTTLKQCSIQEQLEGPLMMTTYGATLQTLQK